MSLIYRRPLRAYWSIVCAALISACTAHGGPGELPGLNTSNAQPAANSKEFHFTHALQRFKVPSGVTQVTITAYGARGGGTSDSQYGYPGALGAAVKATVSVKPGQVLYVVVGGRGIFDKRGAGGAGFNGGGAAGGYAFGGGGSSDVRTGKGKLAEHILVAAGGGGGGETFQFLNSSSGYYYCFGGAGGVGGASTGGQGAGGECGGAPGGGAGGSSKFGGVGGFGGSKGSGSRGSSGSGLCHGANGGNGKLFDGGVGADACAGSGGGGGGGYYGGGGGGSGGCCNTDGGAASGGGGGGGSSFIEQSATHVHRTAGGGHPGNGEIIIAW